MLGERSGRWRLWHTSGCRLPTSEREAEVYRTMQFGLHGGGDRCLENGRADGGFGIRADANFLHPEGKLKFTQQCNRVQRHEWRRIDICGSLLPV